MTNRIPEKIKFILSHPRAKNAYRFFTYSAIAGFSAFSTKCYLEYHLKNNMTIPTSVFDHEQLHSDIIIRSTKPAVSSWWSGWKTAEMDPQVVITKTNSKIKKSRLSMIEKMSNYHGWDDADCRTIAQAISYQTQVALARHPKSDLRLFLPPPVLPSLYCKTEIGKHLRDLLGKMPQYEGEKCLQYYTSDALNTSEEYQIKNPQQGRSWDFEHSYPEYTHAGYDTIRLVEILCLRALLKHSEIEENCMIMVEGGILQILQHCLLEYPDDIEIQECIVRIVANLSVFNSLHYSILQSGWIILLAHAARFKEDDGISMQGSRALQNLDQEAEKNKFVDGIFQFYPTHRTLEPPIADVIFVHGMLGSAFHTWRQCDSVTGERTDCWPKDWFSIDLPQCRIMSLEYDTSLSDWRSVCPHEAERRTLEYRSLQLLIKTKSAGLGNRPLIFVSHSLGGIVVKQMLKLADENSELFGNIVKNCKGIVFYGTPHFGTRIADYSKRIRSLMYPSIEVLELMQDSPKLAVINDFVKEKVNSGQFNTLSFAEAKKTRFGFGITFDLHVVPPESANPGYGDFVTENCNHFEICKPHNRNNSIYICTLNFIRKSFGLNKNKIDVVVVDEEEDKFAGFLDDSFYW